MHFHAREIGEDVRHRFKRGPIELDILPRREMAVAAVVLARDMREHAHLR